MWRKKRIFLLSNPLSKENPILGFMVPKQHLAYLVVSPFNDRFTHPIISCYTLTHHKYLVTTYKLMYIQCISCISHVSVRILLLTFFVFLRYSILHVSLWVQCQIKGEIPSKIYPEVRYAMSKYFQTKMECFYIKCSYLKNVKFMSKVRSIIIAHIFFQRSDFNADYYEIILNNFSYLISRTWVPINIFHTWKAILWLTKRNCERKSGLLYFYVT